MKINIHIDSEPYVSSLLVSNGGAETLALLLILRGSKVCLLLLVYPALLTAVIGLSPAVIGCMDVVVPFL